MSCNCNSTSIFMLVCILDLSGICEARQYGTYDRHETLESLKNEYGFSINIPKEWSDPDFSFSVSDKNRLITFLAKPPGSNSERNNEMLEIYVKKSMSILHVFTCSVDSLSDTIAKSISVCAECIPIDSSTGITIKKLFIKSSTFSGHRWFPPSIEKFYESKSDELIGCQCDTAYMNNKYIVSSSYIVLPDFRITVEFQVLPLNYPKLVSSINKILDSIQIRCGDSWCKSKPFGTVLQ